MIFFVQFKVFFSESLVSDYETEIWQIDPAYAQFLSSVQMNQRFDSAGIYAVDANFCA